jgi:hypothetical protein
VNWLTKENACSMVVEKAEMLVLNFEFYDHQKPHLECETLFDSFSLEVDYNRNPKGLGLVNTLLMIY